MSNFKYLSFELNGKSHSEYIEVIVRNLPIGYSIDLNEVENELLKRRPNGNTSTSRIEQDQYDILSGLTNNITDGNPLVVRIYNKNINKKDYNDIIEIPRPSHADLVSYLTTGQIESGGGSFSGRLTVGIVFAGAICKQILKTKGISLYTLINQIGSVKVNNNYLDRLSSFDISKISENNLPVLNKEDYNLFEEEILKHKANNDSCGGSISTYVVGSPSGLGNAYFDGVESYLSYLIFSIPAVKGVSFGLGENFKDKSGSMVNDEIYFADGEFNFYHNYNGGLNGGITNSDQIIINTTFKPTPTIGIPQRTVNIKTKENIVHTFNGRHDPCIILRGYSVVENIIAFGILDLLLLKEVQSCED